MRGEENCVDWSAVAGEESECGIPTDVQNSIAVHPSEREGANGPKVARWLWPDFKIVCVWPFRLLDYGSTTLCCKI